MQHWTEWPAEVVKSPPWRCCGLAAQSQGEAELVLAVPPLSRRLAGGSPEAPSDSHVFGLSFFGEQLLFRRQIT